MPSKANATVKILFHALLCGAVLSVTACNKKSDGQPEQPFAGTWQGELSDGTSIVLVVQQSEANIGGSIEISGQNKSAIQGSVVNNTLYFKPLSPELANYSVGAVLGPDFKTLDGRWEITFSDQSGEWKASKVSDDTSIKPNSAVTSTQSGEAPPPKKKRSFGNFPLKNRPQ